MPDQREAGPTWLAYVDLACSVLACALWYAFPGVGPWPLVVVLAPWLASVSIARRLPDRTVYDPLLAVFLLTGGLGVWAAYDGVVAWQKFWLIVGGVVLFHALVRAESLGSTRIWLLALFGAGVAVYFIATHDWDAHPAKIPALTRVGRLLQSQLPLLPGHRLHPNVAGGIMAMMFPCAAWVSLDAWRSVRRAGRSDHRVGPKPSPATGASQGKWLLRLIAAIGLSALTLFGLLLTTSRAAWIALGCALLLAAVWEILGWVGGRLARRRVTIVLVLVCLALAAVLLLGFLRPNWLVAALRLVPGPDTGVSRMDLLANTVTLVRDYPIVGAGLGGFMMLYSTYAFLLHVGYIVHSHNLLLNVAVEQGLVAALSLVGMWVLFVRVARAWVHKRSPEGFRLRVASLYVAAMSLTVLLVHGLVDDVLYGSRAVILLFVPLALAPRFPAQTPAEAGTEWRRRLRTLGPLAVPAVLLVLMVLALVWRTQILSRVSSNIGAVHQSQAELGVYRWPDWGLQDEVRRSVDLSRPIAEFERALDLDPRNPAANRRLGQIELSLGEYEDALLHLEAAYELEPGSEVTRQLLGEALIVNGRYQEGAVLWQGVTNAQRQLDLRVWWYQHIGEQELAGRLRQASAAGQ